jgi:hypothetical protein
MAPTAWVLSKVQIVSRQELDLDLMLREGPPSAGLPLLRGDTADRQFPLAADECHIDSGELFSNGMCDELTSRLPLVICYSEQLFCVCNGEPGSQNMTVPF